VGQHRCTPLPACAYPQLVAVPWLCALRDIDVIATVAIAAAIGDATRFATAPDFMAYLGLVPSEHSSGQRRRIGAINQGR
jgi:transposase